MLVMIDIKLIRDNPGLVRENIKNKFQTEKLKLVDEIITVSDSEVKMMTRKLCREEGLFVGYSSGANVVAAIKFGKLIGADKNIVAILCDTGYKYSDL